MPSKKTKRWIKRTMTPHQIAAKARGMFSTTEALVPIYATCKVLELNSGSLRKKAQKQGVRIFHDDEDVACFRAADFLTLALETAENLWELKSKSKPVAPPEKSKTLVNIKKTPERRAGIVALLREASYRQGEVSHKDMVKIAKGAGVVIETVEAIAHVLERSLATRLIEQFARHIEAIKANTYALNENTKAMHGVLTSGQ